MTDDRVVAGNGGLRLRHGRVSAHLEKVGASDVRHVAGAALRIEGIVKSVELVDATTGIDVCRLDELPNLIVDAGLDGVGNGTAIEELANFLAVGTGNHGGEPVGGSLGSAPGPATCAVRRAFEIEVPPGQWTPEN